MSLYFKEQRRFLPNHVTRSDGESLKKKQFNFDSAEFYGSEEVIVFSGSWKKCRRSFISVPPRGAPTLHGSPLINSWHTVFWGVFLVPYPPLPKSASASLGGVRCAHSHVQPCCLVQLIPDPLCMRACTPPPVIWSYELEKAGLLFPLLNKIRFVLSPSAKDNTCIIFHKIFPSATINSGYIFLKHLTFKGI